MSTKILKEIQSKKMNQDTLTIAAMENICLKYKLCPEKYHGGKLNGVDHWEIMPCAIRIFFVASKNCCSQLLNWHDIAKLDLICSKLQIKKQNIP